MKTFLFLVSFSLSGLVYALEPVRILILSAPFGSGHNTAAARIKDVLTEKYQKEGLAFEIIIKNTLEFSPKLLTKVSLNQFAAVQTDMPIVYSKMFESYIHKAEKVDHAGEMTLYKQLMVNTKKLDTYIMEEAFRDIAGKPHSPTVLISTWPGSTEAVINLRFDKKSKLSQADYKVPFAHVQTDNASEDKYFQLFAKDVVGRDGADVVYVPSREVYDKYFHELGFKNVVFTGMPLRLKTAQLPTYEERETEKQKSRDILGLPSENETFMIEAGKNGAANFAVIIASLAKFHQTEVNIIAACGESQNNKIILEILKNGAPRGSAEYKIAYKEMRELIQPRTVKNFLKKGRNIFQIEPSYTDSELVSLIENGLPKRIHLIVRGFESLDPLRAAADVVITKPGGLSTAELGADGRPMVILQEYASGEALPNGPLFEKKNLAIINNDISWIGQQVDELMQNKDHLRSMFAASTEFRKDFKLDRVIPFVENARLQQVRQFLSGPSLARVKKMDSPGVQPICREIFL